jgi:MFS transporter, DHA3 family, macrolide efflux protein
MTNSQSATAGWAPRFFTIWIGQQVSLIGSTLAQFALVWWLTQTTGSATVLAISVAIATLPNVILGPFVGALVDRWPRWLILIFADGVVALASALLVVLFWSGAIQVWQVYLILLVRALGTTFHWPAMAATTPLMVPDKHLPRVAGLNQAIGGAVDILAPPLGAFLLGVTALYNIMLIDVITAALAILPLLFIAVPQPSRHEPGSPVRPTLWADMRVGFKYVWGWSGLRALILYSLILNLIVNPPMELLPLLVTQHFNGQALQLGWLSSAWGFGVLIGGLLLSIWGGFRRRIVTMLMGVTGLGVGVLIVGLTPAAFFPLALAGMFFGAMMNAISNASLFTILQSTITPEMQGRVFALGRSLATAAIPLGMLVAGPLADEVGVRALFLGAGIIYIFLGVGAFFIPALMQLEEQGGTRLASAL